MSRFTVLAFLAVFMPTCLSGASTHYVYSGATGAATGVDWSNAYKDLPSSLIRGDTYVIAGGNYSGHRFNDSGTSTILIRKASSSTSYNDNLIPGWQASFEKNQAVFGNSVFEQGNYTIDGITPNTPTSYWATSGYGIEFKFDSASQTNHLIEIGFQVRAVSNLAFKNVEFLNAGSSYDFEQFGIYEEDDFASANNTFSYSYFKNNQVAAKIAGCCVTGWVFDHDYFDTNWSSAANHGEQFGIWYGSSNHVISNSYFNSYNGTGCIMSAGDGATNSNIQIFGNVFFNMGLNNGDGGAANGTFGTMDSSGSANLTNWKIYNNTFVNGNVRLSSPSRGSATGWVVENNLFYNASADIFNTAPSGTYNYNYYNRSNWGWSVGNNDQNSSTNLFVNLLGLNFHLTTATMTGATLPSPYNVDADGVTRGTNGNWTRGAYNSGAAIKPPTSLQATAQ
jgi:hypothetical protein